MRADLHIHTYYSDGLLSPEQVVKTAKANGVQLIAVTDHDTAQGYKAVKECADREGVLTVPGIEVSAYHCNAKVHMLGYNMNTECPDFRLFAGELFEGSIKRAEDIIFKLNKNGVSLTVEEAAKERFSPETPIHAMHISRAGAKKGYANTPFGFYQKYLTYGALAFSCIARPSPEKTIEVINACGGFCSIAHPARINMYIADTLNLIRVLRVHGLRGIEAVYSAHTKEETAYYKEFAEELFLMVTGGSDTHCNDGSRQIGTPCFEPEKRLLAKLGIC